MAGKDTGRHGAREVAKNSTSGSPGSRKEETLDLT